MTEEKTDTKKQILDIAENLLLERGYNGFSYTDISGALKIKNASIHYHFPKKTDLGVAIIQRATKRFDHWKNAMDGRDIAFSEKLRGFCKLFKKFMEANQVCLGGALETDFKTLPEEMQQETRKFVVNTFLWLEKLLEEGRNKGAFQFPGTASDQALLIVAGMQGMIQIVRVAKPALFDAAVRQIMRQVCV